MHCVEVNYLWHALVCLWLSQELRKPEAVAWRIENSPWRSWKSQIVKATETFIFGVKPMELYYLQFGWLITSNANILLH